MVERIMQLKQGDICLAKLDPSKRAEIGKIRPVAILTASIILEIDPEVLLICPLSTKSHPKFSGLHVEIPPRHKLLKTSYAVVEHCRSIATDRITSKKLTQLTDEELIAVLQRLKCIVGLP